MKAQRFVVVDEKGKPRAWLDAKDGSPGLTFLNRAGKLSAVLRVTDQPHFSLFDRNGKLRISLAIAPDGLGALLFHGEDGKGCVHLGTLPEKPQGPLLGVLMLMTDDGRRIHLVPPIPGEAVLSFHGKDGEVIFQLPKAAKRKKRPGRSPQVSRAPKGRRGSPRKQVKE